MAQHALFEGLVVDQDERPVSVAYVGGEACYVVDDAGFRRHISSEQVDRQVLQTILAQMNGSENLVAEQAAKMLGQDDPFSKAMIENQLKNLDKQIETALQAGIPEGGRTYMGMLGFRIQINCHGEVLRIDQPGIVDDTDGE
jgi:hypothetical protein